MEFDIDQIHTNCLSFNDDGAAIVNNAKLLVEKLHEIVNEQLVAQVDAAQNRSEGNKSDSAALSIR